MKARGRIFPDFMRVLFDFPVEEFGHTFRMFKTDNLFAGHLHNCYKMSQSKYTLFLLPTY